MLGVFTSLATRYAAYLLISLAIGMIAREYARAFVTAKLGDPTHGPPESSGRRKVKSDDPPRKDAAGAKAKAKRAEAERVSRRDRPEGRQ